MISSEDIIEMSGVETLHPGGLDLSRRIATLVALTPTTRVLDVSSGKGAFACLYAKEFGCSVTGIDISERFLRAARGRATQAGVSRLVHFVLADSRCLPFRTGEFDVAVNECAVGLTAIGAPERVLAEMGRVTRPNGLVVIHESTWRRELPAAERDDAAARLGTTPYVVDDWQRMLRAAGCTTEIVEDWSGIEHLWKMRPGHRWHRRNPTDFLTAREKLALFPRIAAHYGLGALVDLLRTQRKINRYVLNGTLGYVLIVARRLPA